MDRDGGDINILSRLDLCLGTGPVIEAYLTCALAEVRIALGDLRKLCDKFPVRSSLSPSVGSG